MSSRGLAVSSGFGVGLRLCPLARSPLCHHGAGVPFVATNSSLSAASFSASFCHPPFVGTVLCLWVMLACIGVVVVRLGVVPAGAS